MKSQTDLDAVGRMINLMLFVTVVALVASVGLVAVAAVVPVEPQTIDPDQLRAKTWPSMPQVGKQLSPLMAKIAGRRLIRPSQVIAAVKDTGAAQRLLSKLNLQGIVSMRGQLVAYIRVDKGGVKSVKKGGKILSFIVEEIADGNVRLSLDGVEVTLGH